MSINPVAVVRDRRTRRHDHARRAHALDVGAYLRRRAADHHGGPGDAVRRSALGQAANHIDQGIGGEFDRAIDQAYRAGLVAGRAAS